MISWITTVGPSPFAVINTLWAAADKDEWVPDRIHLVYDDLTKGSLPGISCVMERIVLEYGGSKPEIFCRSINEDDLGSVFRTYSDIIEKERELENRIAIDITPGRKYMSAFSLYAGLKGGGIDRIYYIHIRGRKYMNIPYPLIPAPYCDIEDLVSIGGMDQ
ncbi:MAG: hypothetical protein JW939_10000 [Candidatus Thermoplasmatota archaeon]|nr:hypothetical protein [Candidatus Thermoplasmatota archaeon]